MENVLKQMNEAAEKIRKKSGDFQPEVGIILGSGLGDLAEEIIDGIVIPYTEIPHMKTSTVQGHSGELFLGTLEGRKVMAFKGRIHYYEGYSMKDITFPVRLMQAMKAKFMVITNACGGLRENMSVGDLMIISDQINLMGDNPLIGTNDDRLGPRFPDMSNAYDRELVKMAVEASKTIGTKQLTGVYAAVTGPNYETYTETQYIKSIGADSVGMSTIPEVIVAAHAGIKVVGISCVTDVIHRPGVEVSHEEVLRVANEAKPRFMMLMKEIVKNLPVIARV
jgi:purine-nucleoside phosphorylase